MVRHPRELLVSMVSLALIFTLSGCVAGSPYGATFVSPISAVQDLFSDDGSDSEPGPTHRDSR